MALPGQVVASELPDLFINQGKRMTRVLVVGYGNPSRRDDGVGLVVVNGLRQRSGLPALDETTDGFDDLGQSLDALFLQQLTPELAETLTDYDRIVFVDAHVGIYPELVHRVAVQPEFDPALVSHHQKPADLLALTEQLYGAAPAAELISIRGFDFDFGTALSPATAEAVKQVIDDLWETFGL
jgi:hydrogenase maturation protease